MNEHPEEKFIDVINENMGIVHKVANMYFRNSEEREDLIQEMLYHLWKGYPGFRGNSKFSTWMYRVCLNTAITYLKKSTRNRHIPFTSRHTQLADTEPTTSGDDLLFLRNAIENLSQLNKALILLYLEELSYEEIAQITGLSKSNVGVRLVRIKKELERELKKTIKQ